MVGFFSEPAPTAGSATADVRRVVCSPDLPLPAAAAVTGLPAAGATAEPYVAKLGLPPVRSAPATSKEPREDPYQCNVCQKTFAVPARLTRHYRTHTGERPFQCDFCDKKFGVKENLSVHRRIHTKERPYKCDVCARAFEHSGKLHRHMRIHTGERPHQCSVCRKTFIQSGQLVIHMRTHTGEKPYVCTVCHKGFTCSKQLKVHSRTHTGEKPYACDICGKSFGYNHVLKLHQVSHYGQKVYKCTLCQDTFTSKKTMEAHIKTHSDSSPQSPIVESMPSQIIQEVSTNSESSCASSITSDKENKDISIHSHPMEQNSVQQPQNQQQCYYLYPRSNESLAYLQPVTGGVNPALLAAAAVAAACEERPQSVSPAQNTMSQYGQYHHPSAYLPPQVNMNYEEVAPLDRGTDIRRRVEAALAVASTEEPILTPPSSNPVSPSPSVSPEPVEFVDCDRQVLILPPRKRSKAILKLMEGSNTVQPPAVRYSSVIQYAGAS